MALTCNSFYINILQVFVIFTLFILKIKNHCNNNEICDKYTNNFK